MHFSIDFIRTFIKVCEERSFSIAAKKLHKSQSAVSSQITLLEGQCGIKLFDRAPRPLRLTQAGVVFLNFAKDLIEKTERLSNSLAELEEGTAGEVNIGAIASIATFLLPSIVKEILNSFKSLKLTISTQNVSQLCDAVRRGELDLAIILSDRQPDGLLVEALRIEPFWFVVAGEHPLARKRRISREALRKTAFVVGQKSSSYSDMLNRMLQRKGLSDYEVAARITTFEGMKEITRTGIGIGILPKYTVEREIRTNTLARLRVNGIELEATIYLIENVRRGETPTIASVRQFIASRMKGMRPN